MAKKAKSKASVGSYVFVGLMAAAMVVGLVGMLIATHFRVAGGETTTYTLANLAEYFANLNKVPGADYSTAALTCANIFGWVAVAGAVALVVLQVLKLFGVKVPSIVTWILVGVTLVSAVVFIVCSATVCVDYYGGKEAYDNAVKMANAASNLTKSQVLTIGAGSYMTVIGTALVPIFAVANKLMAK